MDNDDDDDDTWARTVTIEIIRALLERDAAVFNALAHPRLYHCVACDHEWVISLGTICDWCGANGKEIPCENVPLAKT